jgi:excisionase family DNA binding protein
VDPLLLSVRDAARALGIGRTSLYRMISEGSVLTVRLGGRRLVRLDSLREVVERASSNRKSDLDRN